MTAIAVTEVDIRQTTRSTWRSIVALAWREGRRMVLSPVLGVLLLFILLMGGVEMIAEAKGSIPSAKSVYDTITFFTALYLGLLFYLATHLVTSSARRTGAEPQLAASALSPRQRSAGLCLGVLCGPGLVALVLMVTAGLLGNTLTTTGFDGFSQDPPVSGPILVQLGLLLIGGGLFGVMWATWLRFPGSLPLGFLALIFMTAWLLNGDRAPVDTWPWLAPYISSPEWFDESWTHAGSHVWHAIYLVGLCSLAFCATMLRPREGRARWVAITAGVLCGTVLVGAVQLS